MIVLLSWLLLIPAIATAIVTLVFLVEVASAVFLPVQKPVHLAHGVVRQPVVILVPAHNESAGIRPTLNDIVAQMQGNDRLLVVADNCTDDTAEIAAAARAEVVIRRRHLWTAANDIGFARQQDGTYLAYISEYDREVQPNWHTRLLQAHGVHVAQRQLRKLGCRNVQLTRQADGTVLVVASRYVS